jgi:hypothetical protein
LKRHQQGSKSVSKLTLRQLELKYELAQIKLNLLKNLEYYVTLMEAMQGQIDQLGHELLALDMRIAKLEANQ